MEITAKAIADKIEYSAKVNSFRFRMSPDSRGWVFSTDQLRIENDPTYIQYRVVVTYRALISREFLGSDASIIIETVQKIRFARLESLTKDFEKYLEGRDD